MIIEVEGIGFPNKGAELMLYAVAEQIQQHFGEGVELCCRPWQGHREGYKILGHKGISMLGEFSICGRSVGWMTDYLPEKIIDTFGVVRPKDVDVVLDASGLRYSDRWGPFAALVALKRYRKLTRQGKKIIMLPQAFGPFDDKQVADAVREVVSMSALTFARDRVSLGYLHDLCGEQASICQAPDFTNLVNPFQDFNDTQYDGKVIIIPNQRMLDKTSDLVSSNYYSYLLNLARHFNDVKQKMVILNHEGMSDRNICEQLSKDCGGIPVYSHWDPVYIKSAIGRCKLLISSRFHGCVSALSQGVPAIATSWNHKYEMLLEEYGVSELLVDLNNDEVDKDMLEAAMSVEMRKTIVTNSALLKTKSVNMWNQVFNAL